VGRRLKREGRFLNFKVNMTNLNYFQKFQFELNESQLFSITGGKFRMSSDGGCMRDDADLSPNCDASDGSSKYDWDNVTWKSVCVYA
jgi:hypothetical protein